MAKLSSSSGTGAYRARQAIISTNRPGSFSEALQSYALDDDEQIEHTLSFLSATQLAAPTEPAPFVASSRASVQPASSAVSIPRERAALTNSASSDSDSPPPPSNPLRTASASVGTSIFASQPQPVPSGPSLQPPTPSASSQPSPMPRSILQTQGPTASSVLSRSAVAGVRRYPVSLIEYDVPPRSKTHVPSEVRPLPSQ